MTKPDPETQTPAKTVKRKAPELKENEAGDIEVVLQRDGQVRDLYGVKSGAMAGGILKTALNALGVSGAPYRDMMLAVGQEMEPRDAVEAMLVSQQVATHTAMMALSGKVMDATSPRLREGYERSMTRLSRTFLAQVDGLKRYRSRAQQIVRVERVDVHDGGSGDCRHGGGWGGGTMKNVKLTPCKGRTRRHEALPDPSALVFYAKRPVVRGGAAQVGQTTDEP